MNLGENIKKYRKQKGLTQKELASKVGVTASTITKYEKGDLQPNLDTIKEIAKALDISYVEIIDDNQVDLAQQTINKLVRSIVGDEIYTEVKIDQEERLNEFIDYIKTLIQHDIDIEADIDALSYDDKKILFNAFIDNMKLNIKAILYDNKNK